MKKIILFTILILTTTFAFCQVTSLDSVANKIVDQKITAFSKTLDSVVTKSGKTTSTSTIIDTLSVPLNAITAYHINLIVSNTTTKDEGTGDRIALIQNNNGTYPVPTVNKEVATYLGKGTVSGVKWVIVIINKLPVIQLTIPTGVPLKWTLTYTKIQTTNS